MNKLSKIFLAIIIIILILICVISVFIIKQNKQIKEYKESYEYGKEQLDIYKKALETSGYRIKFNNNGTYELVKK